MLDGNPRQRFGQLAPAVLVLDAAGDQLLAGFGFDGMGVHWHGINDDAEQEKLCRIKAFRTWDHENRRRIASTSAWCFCFHGFDGVGGFLLDLFRAGAAPP